MSRRLPVYVLLDTSESMAGEPMRQVRDGLKVLVTSMTSDPRCLETVHLCVITFGAQARTVFPLNPLDTYSQWELPMGTGTSLGGALRLLLHSMKTQLHTTSVGDVKGDWRPLIFVISDGMATDSWEAEARELRTMTDNGSCITIALACGDDADSTALHRLTPNVLRSGTDPSALAAFFKWVTASVKTASLGVVPAKGALGSEPPREIRPDSPTTKALAPCLFLVGRCQRNKLPYVLKHRWNGTTFVGTDAVALNEIEIGGSTRMSVDGGNVASLPCPHCKNPIWAYCSCKRIFCCPSGDGDFTCPWCQLQQYFSIPDEGFSLDGSGG